MSGTVDKWGVVDKWGITVAQRGFSQVPNYLLLINHFIDEELRLSPTELLLLIQLVGTWWKKDSMPFPSMATLSTRCGVSERQIQRAVNNLVKLGLVTRMKRRTKGIISSNVYDLLPLVNILEEISKAFPNDFPRKVSKDVKQKVSSIMNKYSEENIKNEVLEN